MMPPHNSTGEHAEDHHDILAHFSLVIFIIVCLAICVLIDDICRRVKFTILTPVLLFAVGFFMPQSYKSLLRTHADEMTNLEDTTTWFAVGSYKIMIALHPIIVFELAFGIEWFHFKKRATEIVLFGVIFFVLSCIIFALWTFVLFVIVGIKWPFSVSLLYSSIVMPTDPATSLMITADFNIPKRLRLLLTAEALINNGISVAFYRTGHLLVLNQLDVLETKTVLLQIFFLSLSILLSVFCGYVIARISTSFLDRIQDKVMEISVVVASVWAVYGLCYLSSWGASGIFGVISYGICLNSFKESICPQTLDDLAGMWQVFSYWAFAVLHILSGVIANVIFDRMVQPEFSDWIQVLSISSWVYSGSYIARFLSLALYTFATYMLFRNTNADLVLPMRFTIALTWFGIKGSLPLLLCKLNHHDAMFIFSPYAIIAVVVTVAVSNIHHSLNATYVAYRLLFTELVIVKSNRINLLIDSINSRLSSVRKYFSTLHSNFWGEASWQRVENECTILKSEDADYQDLKCPFKDEIQEDSIEEEDSGARLKLGSRMKKTKSIFREASSRKAKSPPKESVVGVHSHMERKRTKIIDRITIMDVMLSFTRSMGQKQALSSLAHRCLNHAINEAIDYNRAIDIDGLLKRIHPWECLRVIDTWGKRHILDRFENLLAAQPKWESYIIGRNITLSSDFWKLSWHIVVYFHACLPLFATSHEENARNYLYVIFCLCLLCMTEIIVRFAMHGRNLYEYLANRALWHYFDFLRLTLYPCSAICIALYIKLCSNSSSVTAVLGKQGSSTATSHQGSVLDVHHGDSPICTYLFASSCCIVIFLAHIVFWVFFLFLRIFFGYLHEYVVEIDQMSVEMMHCVILMSEHVMSRLERSRGIILEVEEDKIKLETENLQMKRNAERNIIDIINLQPILSRRMIYTKTRQLARMMLSEAVDCLEEKVKSGEVDEFEYEIVKEHLMEQIELTRKVFVVDKVPPPLFDESRLELVPWIVQSDKRELLIEFIMNNLEDKVFPKGSFLMTQGEKSNGVFYIVSGVCRFAVRQPKGELKPLHLLYAGRFVGESAFFTPMAPGMPVPERSGSVYAETYVTCKFLHIKHVAQLLQLDPTIKQKFEESAMAYKCHDVLRRMKEYIGWTTPALDKFIRNNWIICNRQIRIDRLSRGTQLILLKGLFTIKNEKKTISLAPEIIEGPKFNIIIHGTPENRCFYIELIGEKPTDRTTQFLGPKVATA